VFLLRRREHLHPKALPIRAELSTHIHTETWPHDPHTVECVCEAESRARICNAPLFSQVSVSSASAGSIGFDEVLRRATAKHPREVVRTVKASTSRFVAPLFSQVSVSSASAGSIGFDEVLRRATAKHPRKMVRAAKASTSRFVAPLFSQVSVSSASAGSIGFDEVLRRATAGQHEGRASVLGALPRVFTLGLAWDTARPSKESLSAVLGAIDERIDLATVLGVERGAPQLAEVVGLVCYHAAHYCAIVRDAASGAWRQFDDSAVLFLGET